MARKLSYEEIRKLLAYDAKPPAEKAKETRKRRQEQDQDMDALRHERDEARRELAVIAERWETLKGAYLHLEEAVEDALGLLDPEHPAAKRLRDR
ncbi:MAG TPA: hypothetical protein VIP09_11725 [Dehalococcoidia bacterium]